MLSTGGVMATVHQLAYAILVVENTLQGKLFSDDQSNVVKQRQERELSILTKTVKTWLVESDGATQTKFLLATEAEVIEHIKGMSEAQEQEQQEQQETA